MISKFDDLRNPLIACIYKIDEYCENSTNEYEKEIMNQMKSDLKVSLNYIGCLKNYWQYINNQENYEQDTIMDTNKTVETVISESKDMNKAFSKKNNLANTDIDINLSKDFPKQFKIKKELLKRTLINMTSNIINKSINSPIQFSLNYYNTFTEAKNELNIVDDLSNIHEKAVLIFKLSNDNNETNEFKNVNNLEQNQLSSNIILTYILSRLLNADLFISNDSSMLVIQYDDTGNELIADIDNNNFKYLSRKTDTNNSQAFNKFEFISTNLKKRLEYNKTKQISNISIDDIDINKNEDIEQFEHDSHELIIVEDNESIIKSYTRMCKKKNINHRIFQDGIDAKEYLKKIFESNSYCKIINIMSDQIMPIMNGTDLYEWIQNNKKEYTVNFVLVTANEDKYEDIQDVIIKPLTIKHLERIKNDYLM